MTPPSDKQRQFSSIPFRAPVYDTPEKYIEALIELISEASPLAWVAHQDMDGAAAWEAKALALIQQPGGPEVVNGDPIPGCDPSAR